MAAATRRKAGPVKDQAGVELRRNNKVRVDGRAGRITGFSRDGRSVYVRFEKKLEGKPLAAKFSRLEVEPTA
jgi:hypothetical protein